MTEQRFHTVIRVGTIVLALSLLANVYLVVRHVMVYRQMTREVVHTEQVAPQLAAQQRLAEQILREFAAKANQDPKVAAILAKHSIVTNGKAPTPAGGNQ